MFGFENLNSDFVGDLVKTIMLKCELNFYGVFLQAFESPDTLNSCAGFLRQYVVESSATAACLIVAKKSIAFPQVI